MVRPTITVPNLDELVNRYQIQADRIEDVAVEAINETLDWAEEEMKKNVEPYNVTKNAYNSIKKEPAIASGNYISGRVGALYIREGDKEGFHLIYMEEGSPTRPSTPWFRPVLSKKSKMRKIQEAVFRRNGVDVG